MLKLPPTRLIVCCLLFVCTAWQAGWSQDNGETSALTVLRLQAEAQAREFIQHIRISPQSRVGLKVAGSANEEFTVNVFLEVLQHEGIDASIAEQNAEAVLDILVLAQSVSYEEPSMGTWKRTTRTAMEARLRKPSTGEVEYLGNIDNSKVDVVGRKEDGWWSSNGAMLMNSPPGAFEKLLIPITVIASAVVIVYLFFTVRN